MSGIDYRESAEGLAPAELTGFFQGWAQRPSPETHLCLLRQSDAVVLAVERASGRVVGFITAISDGVLSAYIPLLEVLPEYQGRGIGSELARRMLARLEPLYIVDVVCDPELQPFYERFGLRPAQAMIRRNRAAQAGPPERSG
ncbi:MAG TPA: GNAT family N-acetyltransferase [Thermomicrobiaceae bacterium]|nr:GNAT family N-acetyltransferase [Thermomicrobiaceae bacterium]